jgi:transposase
VSACTSRTRRSPAKTGSFTSLGWDPSDGHLARHAGVVLLEASSGKRQGHRLDCGGNGQLNCALHRIAITQGRVHAPGRAYLERKQSEGKNRREAIRLARTVYTTLKSESALT